MKFPKEKVLITHEVQECLARGDYFGVYKLKDRILENSGILDNRIFQDLIFSTFLIGNFDDAVLIYSELKKRGVETYSTVYYALLSLIANEDMFQAASLINKSELLSSPEAWEFHQEGGANYSNLLPYADYNDSFTLALLLANFVKGIMREGSGMREINRELLLFRFFDLVNLVYELGYPLKIIQELTNAMKIIFNLSL